MNARLVISGSNFKTDTIPLDLNPIHIEDFSIDSVATELDYRGGVKIRWQPLRNEPGVGRRSDFLGYVVTRGRETPPGDTVLLTAER